METTIPSLNEPGSQGTPTGGVQPPSGWGKTPRQAADQADTAITPRTPEDWTGDRIARFRAIDYDINQETFGKWFFGVTKKTIGAWEKGTSRPRRHQLERLCLLWGWFHDLPSISQRNPGKKLGGMEDASLESRDSDESEADDDGESSED